MPETPFDPYRVLNLSPQATLLEIKKAFRRLARQYHPDLNPQDEAAAVQFKQISAAYELLSDRQRRADYDAAQDTSHPPQKQSAPQFRAAQGAYQQGLDFLALRDYTEAIAAFDQAIALNDDWIEAYLGRCRANEELKNDRAILEDCYKILQIDPQFAQAYYYQGRARLRLGYQQGAVESYTHAISLNDTYALAYYQRGRSLLTLRERDRARQDLQRASQLFRVQDDLGHYRQAEDLLNSLSPFRPRPFRSGPFRSGTQPFFSQPLIHTLLLGLRSIPDLLQSPSANLQPIAAQIGTAQAAWIGIFYGLLTAGSTVLGATLLGQASPFTTSLDPGLAVLRLFGTLLITTAIAYKLTKGRFTWSESSFLAGVVVLPITGWALLGWLSLWLGNPAWLLLMAATGSYSTILLYLGCTQLIGMAESFAMGVVPLLLVLSSAMATLWLS
ncbi:MAG: DnaJ domain-containing protein [Thermosynechococcaceae cyanobacterium MS004]|nr:DnaJ domain-containing protein [Thermosynechococcaceae cyanobacterium MS004]